LVGWGGNKQMRIDEKKKKLKSYQSFILLNKKNNNEDSGISKPNKNLLY